jgi:hypothetical protein
MKNDRAMGESIDWTTRIRDVTAEEEAKRKCITLITVPVLIGHEKIKNNSSRPLFCVLVVEEQ